MMFYRAGGRQSDPAPEEPGDQPLSVTAATRADRARAAARTQLVVDDAVREGGIRQPWFRLTCHTVVPVASANRPVPPVHSKVKVPWPDVTLTVPVKEA
jgi:hypothetical protein